MPGTSDLKYARLECEYRYLLATQPAGLCAGPSRLIRDRYLRGTRLRLREVSEPGRPPAAKLGQKIRLDEAGAGRIAHTSLYLDGAEYALLAALPADELTKSRTLLPVILAGVESFVAVDVFSGSLTGLVLAELDLGAPGTRPSDLDLAGLDVRGEVTADERFTGGALARTSPATVAALLAEFGLPE